MRILLLNNNEERRLADSFQLKSRGHKTVDLCCGHEARSCAKEDFDAAIIEISGKVGFPVVMFLARYIKQILVIADPCDEGPQTSETSLIIDSTFKINDSWVKIIREPLTPAGERDWGKILSCLKILSSY